MKTYMDVDESARATRTRANLSRRSVTVWKLACQIMVKHEKKLLLHSVCARVSAFVKMIIVTGQMCVFPSYVRSER